jgi:hypothetical protein
MEWSFTDKFYKNTLLSMTVEFAIENLFPWAEVKRAIRYCNNDFSPHDLAFHVRVCIVFTSSIVIVSLWAGVKWGELF